ncbi:MAG: GAF domain-containing protein [Bacteroidetes bacterium]|nr:GAF domain-containing protein [Bacteroidota bacterium]
MRKPKHINKEFETLKVLGDIGRDITSSLDSEKILFTVYEKVNKLMDATVFGIGLYDAKKKIIDYQLAIAEKKKYKPYSRNMKDKNQFPVWCIENKKPVFINNVSQEYKKYIKKYFDSNRELEDGSTERIIHSMLYQPIIVKKKVLGIISVQSYRKNAYDKFQLEILQNIASYTGIAIENARLLTEAKTFSRESVAQKNKIEKTFQHTKLLAKISEEIASSLSVEEIISRVYKSVNDMMDASVFAIGLHMPETNELYYPGDIEKGEKLPPNSTSLEEEKKTAVKCFKNKKEFFINDWENFYFREHGVLPPKADVGDTPSSIIYLPLLIKEKPMGVLTVQSFRKNAYTEYHLNILRALAVSTAKSLENARLYENMEGEVKARTVEIRKQKEEIEQTYQNVKLLSEIGQKITSSLSVEKIIVTVYDHINQLMDASSFWIGIYNEEKQTLDYPMGIERGQHLSFAHYNLSDDYWIPVWSFKNKKEVFVNDYEREYNKYIPSRPLPKAIAGEAPQSSIWIPLFTKDKKQLGILTIQSFQKNAYTEFHLNVARNLALFTAIALENALLYEELMNKNKDITDSINYAKKIQNTILPSEEKIKELLPESFILYKPKDIVSGDFYFIDRAHGNGKIIAAAVDCTGHGVPGAFLTIVGNDLLDNIINERGITNPKEIISEMNEGIIHRLSLVDDVQHLRDGMDMAVCTIDKSSNQLSLLYSGAYNPLYFIRDGKLIEMDAIRFNIGSIPETAKEKISCHTMEIEKGDTVYLFSDGYADQLNHDTGKKFMKGRFKQLLLDIHQKPMSEQKQILEATHIEWKHGLFQTDDILVMGFRF